MQAGTLAAADDAGEDLMLGSGVADEFDGKGGDDELYGYAGVDTLKGGAGDDFLDGGADDDFLEGRCGRRHLRLCGQHGADTIQSDDDGGNNLYFRNARNIDSFNIDRNADGDVVIKISGDESNFVTILNAAYRNGDYILHYGADDTPLGKLSVGTNEDDTTTSPIPGTDDIDLQFGLLGDDTLLSSAGADRLDGGEGTDTASYADSPNTDDDTAKGVTVNLKTGVSEGDDAEGDTLVGIENLIGSAFVDTLTGDDKDNTLEGGAGADTARWRQG